MTGGAITPSIFTAIYGSDGAAMEREPTPDEAACIRWWNALTERERAEWMRRAGDTGVTADAWEAYKRAAFIT